MPGSYRKQNSYGKLKDVLLGSYFLPEFFSSIPNNKIKTPLQRISHEINEDLEYFETVLKQFNCNVLRPDNPMDKFNETSVADPPLQVRNNHAVIGDTLYQFNLMSKYSYHNVLDNFNTNIRVLVEENIDIYHQVINNSSINYNKKTDTWFSYQKYQELAGADWPEYKDFVQGNYQCPENIRIEINSFMDSLTYESKEFLPLQSPNILNLDNKIYVDAHEYYDYAGWLKSKISDPRPVEQFTSKAGHVDGCFVILNNNTIIGIDSFIDYQKYFPGYYIIAVPNESYIAKIKEFQLLREKNKGRWWVPGEEYNVEFINFVENHLQPWIGHVHETIFDVNVLVLDEHNVCVSNITPEIKSEFKKRKIDYTVIPWRHRFFVDGGLHCITLDLHRE